MPSSLWTTVLHFPLFTDCLLWHVYGISRAWFFWYISCMLFWYVGLIVSVFHVDVELLMRKLFHLNDPQLWLVVLKVRSTPWWKHFWERLCIFLSLHHQGVLIFSGCLCHSHECDIGECLEGVFFFSQISHIDYIFLVKGQISRSQLPHDVSGTPWGNQTIFSTNSHCNSRICW